MQLMLPTPEKELLAGRAHLAGLSYSEYVIELLRREPVDGDGQPTWLPLHREDDEGLPLAM